MRMYIDYVYQVIELTKAQFDSVDQFLIGPFEDDHKYLLGNAREIDYLKGVLNLPESWEMVADYFKLLVERETNEGT